MKRYVRERVEKNADGEKLVVIEVLPSKPAKVSYIVWLK